MNFDSFKEIIMVVYFIVCTTAVIGAAIGIIIVPVRRLFKTLETFEKLENSIADSIERIAKLALTIDEINKHNYQKFTTLNLRMKDMIYEIDKTRENIKNSDMDIEETGNSEIDRQSVIENTLEDDNVDYNSFKFENLDYEYALDDREKKYLSDDEISKIIKQSKEDGINENEVPFIQKTSQKVNGNKTPKGRFKTMEKKNKLKILKVNEKSNDNEENDIIEVNGHFFPYKNGKIDYDNEIKKEYVSSRNINNIS